MKWLPDLIVTLVVKEMTFLSYPGHVKQWEDMLRNIYLPAMTSSLDTFDKL